MRDVATQCSVVRLTGWDGNITNERLTGVTVEILAAVDADVHLGQHFTSNHHTIW